MSKAAPSYRKTLTFRRAALLAALIAFSGVSAPAQADPRQGPEPIDLLDRANVRIDGAGVINNAGSAVADAGDVNGDGLDDVIVGAIFAGADGYVTWGAAYVIFSQPSVTHVDLANLGDNGFRMDAARAWDSAGGAVAAAGDVNGDGVDDVIVGAVGFDNQNGSGAGASYVIWGKESSTPIDLGRIGTPGNTEGFRIDGAVGGDESGESVGGAGDVNGDGVDDVIVGASRADNNGETSGSAWVVYGRDSNGVVDLADIGTPGNAEGFRIDGAQPFDWAAGSVAIAGDVNDDGFDDAIVGAPGADDNGRENSGSAYVVYGGDGLPEEIELGTLGENGLRIDGAEGVDGCDSPPFCVGDSVGTSVSGAGDVNGDGVDDVVIGATDTDLNGRENSGSAYVINGGSGLPQTIDLAALGDQGFQIDGAATWDIAGHSVAGAGDVNNDGYADVIIGAPLADLNDREDSGAAYVIFGGAEPPPTIDLLTIGERGYRIDGAAAQDHAGWSLAGARDVNGDGIADMIIGAPLADNNDIFNSGSAYIIYGSSDSQLERITDPVCDRYGNNFGVYRFFMDTPESHDAHRVSRLAGGYLPCGSEITNASGDSYPENGSGSQFVRFDIEAPPGVMTRRVGDWVDGYFVGTLNASLLTWDGTPRDPGFERRSSMGLRVDQAPGTDCPADAVACYRGDTVGGDISGHLWIWVTRDRDSRETLTVGEFHNDSGSPAGITRVFKINLCGRASGPSGHSCGVSTWQPWLRRNGLPSYPMWSNRRTCYPNWGWAGHGIFTLTATNRDGETTDLVETCVVWGWPRKYWRGARRGKPSKCPSRRDLRCRV